ncbi:MAG: heavy metal translocating P-type ATPase [Myxococcales bacterium]|nr:heavy metal translocating P-type ATPase [Myxococcales bacterium]
MLITLALLAATGALAASTANFVLKRPPRAPTPPADEPPAVATAPQARPAAPAPVDNALELPDLDRKVALALGSTVAAGVGALAVPAVSVLSLVGVVYLSKDLAVGLADELRRRHRPSVDGLALIVAGVCVAKGMLFACSLNMTLAMVSRRLSVTIRRRSEADVLRAFDRLPTRVRVLRDGEERSVELLEITAGDELIVAAGEMVPVDGVVTRGAASLDQRALTGEAQPVERGVGEAVLAMTWVAAGELVIRVEKAGPDTVAGEISRVLRSAMRQRTEGEIRAQEIGNKTVLPTLAASILVHPWVGPTGGLAILQAHPKYKTIITSHLGLLTTIGALARAGVLVKDARALERLATVDTFVFDKTGTLTLSELSVEGVHPEPGVDGRALLGWAASLEAHQTHPIGRALVDAATAEGLALAPPSDGAVSLGFGLAGTIDGRRLVVGSARFMADEGVDVSSALAERGARCAEEGRSLVLVGAEGRALGGIELSARLRPEARAVVDALRGRGHRVYISSGDRAPATRWLADALGVDGHFAEMLPGQKAELVQRLRAEGRTVCFVGDGINDAVALEAADVSISLGDASTIARDAASVVLLDGHLAPLAALMRQATRERARGDVATGIVLAPHLVGLSGVLFHGLGFVPMIFISQLGLLAGMSYMWGTRRLSVPLE